jgi:hypothetical protein
VSGDVNVRHVRYKEHESTLTCKEDQCNFMARGISTRSEDEHMLDGKGRECMSEGNRHGCTSDG